MGYERVLNDRVGVLGDGNKMFRKKALTTAGEVCVVKAVVSCQILMFFPAFFNSFDFSAAPEI